jgi:Nif-specific regulatory protein
MCDLEPDQQITLGRSRDNVVVLRDEHASRLHAKILFEEGRWCIRDLGLNGTRVDGERIAGRTELEHGQEIRIGDTRLRFTLANGAYTNATPAQGYPVARHTPRAGEAASMSTTRLQADELTALCSFMGQAVEESEAHQLIRRALQLIHAQTSASIVGYLSANPSDPIPKLVLPDSAQVDIALSRQLTRRVQRDGKTVWLGTDMAETQPTDSLSPFHDALCLPLKSAGQPLGALHVYKAGNFFTERDVRFCEALAGYLGNSLHVLRVRRNLEAENSRLRFHLPSADELVGDSTTMQRLRDQIARAAPQPFTVLVHGESGSGKELVALALHKRSQRAQGPLVVVNCAAIAPTLMESELFGYRKGSFSGADRDHPGMFQQADEGTLFLDEVGELSLDCQAKLLRVIEGKSFRPIGTTAEVKADFRIVAATHRDLEKEVAEGRFRNDLFYRLRVIQLTAPPLREHPEDMPFLVQYFLDKLSVECRRSVKLTDAAMRKLQAYSWPGNVRQLRAVLESAVVMSESDVVDENGIHLFAAGEKPDAPPSLNLNELEAWAIERAMRRTDGNVTAAAKILGISRDTLHTRLKKKSTNGEA